MRRANARLSAQYRCAIAFDPGSTEFNRLLIGQQQAVAQQRLQEAATARETAAKAAAEALRIADLEARAAEIWTAVTTQLSPRKHAMVKLSVRSPNVYLPAVARNASDRRAQKVRRRELSKRGLLRPAFETVWLATIDVVAIPFEFSSPYEAYSRGGPSYEWGGAGRCDDTMD